MKRILLFAFVAILFALSGYQPVQLMNNGIGINLGYEVQEVDAKSKCKARSITHKPEQGNWTVGGPTRHNVSVWSTEGKFKGELMLHLGRNQIVTLRNAGGKEFFRDNPGCNSTTLKEFQKLQKKERARKIKLTITVDELKSLGMVVDPNAPSPPPPVDCNPTIDVRARNSASDPSWGIVGDNRWMIINVWRPDRSGEFKVLVRPGETRDLSGYYGKRWSFHRDCQGIEDQYRNNPLPVL